MRNFFFFGIQRLIELKIDRIKIQIKPEFAPGAHCTVHDAKCSNFWQKKIEKRDGEINEGV